MRKIILWITTGVFALVISCQNKKQENPVPMSESSSSKKVQYRIEAANDFDFDDAPVAVSVIHDGNGNPFLVISYNPIYIKAVSEYPAFSIKPVLSYPAFANAYALQDGVAGNECLAQSLVLLSSASTYLSSQSGICNYINELKKTLDICSAASDQLQPTIDLLSAFSDCN